MIRKVANYIDMVDKDIKQFSSPMFCWQETIPKASSTSCLNATWKSDQTDLKQELAHTYNFQHHTEFCNGHPKLKATQGIAYQLDLADTVYCSCSAITVKPKIHKDHPPLEVILNPCGNITLGTRDYQDHSMAEIILDPTLTISPDKTFSIRRKNQYFSHTKQSFATTGYSNSYQISQKEHFLQKSLLQEEIQLLKDIMKIIKTIPLKQQLPAAANLVRSHKYQLGKNWPAVKSPHQGRCV